MLHCRHSNCCYVSKTLRTLKLHETKCPYIKHESDDDFLTVIQNKIKKRKYTYTSSIVTNTVVTG